MNCFCDYEPPSFYRVELRLARKQYYCDECSGLILPKERYEYVSGKWDGDLGTYRTCERCVEIREFVSGNVPCFCWGHSNIENDAKAAIDDAYGRALEEVIGLRFGFFRRLVKRNRLNAEKAECADA
jgi:hypothetical protein